MWKENELKGKGMVYNTPFRKMSTENPNWWSRDALEGFMPWQSPYISMDANPINLIDPLGLKTTKTKDNPGNEPDEYMTDEVAVTAERTGEKKKEPRETPISLPQKADDSDGSSRSASLGQAISNGSVSDEDMTAIANHWINNHTQDVTVKPTMLYPRQPGIDYNPIGTNPFVDGFVYPGLAFTTKVGIMFATGGIGNMFLPDMYGEDAAFKPVEMVYDIASLKFLFAVGIEFTVKETIEYLAKHPEAIKALSINKIDDIYTITEFGKNLKKIIIETTKNVKGSKVYKVTEKSEKYGLKKGDQIYLDKAHGNHLEVFDKRGKFKKVINLDGSLNVSKTARASKRTID